MTHSDQLLNITKKGELQINSTNKLDLRNFVLESLQKPDFIDKNQVLPDESSVFKDD